MATKFNSSEMKSIKKAVELLGSVIDKTENCDFDEESEQLYMNIYQLREDLINYSRSI